MANPYSELMKNTISVIFILTALQGCVGEWDRKLDENRIETSLVNTSALIDGKNLNFKIKEYKNILHISLSYRPGAGFPFPVDTTWNDTLTETRFFLKLMCDNRPLLIDTNVAEYSGFPVVKINNELLIPFRKSHLLPLYQDEIKFPLNLFHNLPAGKRKIEGELFITHFYGMHYDTVSDISTELIKPFDKLKCNVRFILKIPEIYLTEIYTNGFVLRNDETFSPLGMDFSFREGYPDIYWKIFYPSYGGNEYEFHYWRSPEARNATTYEFYDTVYLYHFSLKDNLKIGIYDRDDLSRDDYISDLSVSLNTIVSDTFNVLKPVNLEWYKIKAVSKGCVNKSAEK